MNYTLEEISVVSKTSRATRAVGKKAVVPKYVMKEADAAYVGYCSGGKYSYILDYGSGYSAIHTQELRRLGYKNTFAYDFNLDPKLKDIAVSYRHLRHLIGWDIIFASNVFNVQTSVDMLKRTLCNIKLMCGDYTTVIVNFPKSPRKNPVTVKQLQELLETYFTNVVQIDKKNHVFIFQK